MINEKLNVGDYIFSPSGKLCRIIKVNKTTYTYTDITKEYRYNDNVAFNGIKNNSYLGSVEFFKCEEPQVKALKLIFERYQKADKLEVLKNEVEELLGKAKTFLNQIADIEEVEVDDDD